MAFKSLVNQECGGVNPLVDLAQRLNTCKVGIFISYLITCQLVLIVKLNNENNNNSQSSCLHFTLSLNSFYLR